MRRALLLLALLTVSAGCGTGDTVSLDPVAEAAGNTAQVSSMHMSMQATMSVPGSDVPISMTAQGEFDNERKRGSLRLDMSDIAKSVAGTKLGDPKLWRGVEVFDFGQRPILYMRFPFLTQSLPSGKRWIRIDLQLVGEAMGVNFSQLLQGAQSNPAQQLDYLRAVSGDLEEIAREQVRGVETTHYRTTVDLRKYPELLPEDRRKSAEDSIEQVIKLTGLAKYPVDVWVDSKQLVRRMAFDQTFKTGMGRMSMQMTVDYFGFGTPVRVTLPARSQTADISELIKAVK
jgi:hypothetical protein